MFPKGELEAYLLSKDIRKIGEIPFNPSVGMACEAGIPIVESHPTGAESTEFINIAKTITELVN